MGRGCALEAAKLYPRLPRLLGERLEKYGNTVQFFSREQLNSRQGLFTFPVKHEWPDTADLELITASAASLHIHLLGSSTYVMPRAGCGNGHLLWQDVRPILAKLPDNVVVIDFEK